MNSKITLPVLSQYFSRLVNSDPNATLDAACRQLQEQNWRVAGNESGEHTKELISEMDKLIRRDGGDCPVSDFLPSSDRQADGGPGTHG